MSLACVKGICILKTELIPFLWSALVGSCPRSVFPVLSSTLPTDGDFRTKRAAGQGWEHQPGVQERWLQPSALTQPPKVTLDKSCRLPLHGRQSRLTHANTHPMHAAGRQPSSGSGGQPRSGDLLGDTAGKEETHRHLPSTSNHPFKMWISPTGYCWGCVLRALQKSELLVWPAERSKELTLSEGEISCRLRLKMPVPQKLL